MARRSSFKIAGKTERFMIPVLDLETKTILDELSTQINEKISVLDIGCGEQPLRSYIDQRAWQYKSMDIQQNSLRNVDFIGKIDEEIEINEQFDLLICTEVLEHVLDWKHAFENMAKLSRKGAKLLITTPFFFPLHEEPYDFWRPTTHTLHTFAVGAGFSVEKMNRAGNGWQVLGTLLNSMFISSKAVTWKQRIQNRVLQKILRYLYREIETEKISQYAKTEGSWYLSNIVLLERK